MRIQFYPTTDLEKKLNQESTRLGIALSVLVVDALLLWVETAKHKNRSRA